MASILVGLALYSKFFRRNEKHNMKLEAKYFESLKSFNNGVLEKSKLLDEGINYFKNLGLSLEESKKRVEKDLIIVKSST